MNRFSTSLFIVMALLIASLWTCNSCYKAKIAELESRPDVVVNPVEVTRVDSIPVHDTIQFSKPVPVAYIPKGYVKAADMPPVILDWEGAEEVHDSAYVAWLIRVKDDYFSKVAYKRTIPTPYGNIIQQDTAEQNRLLAGSTILDLKFPETTITKTVEAPKRNQVYLGINFQGRPQDLLTAFGPSVLFKTKTDRIIELGALYNKEGFVQYQAGLKWKLSFNHLK